MQADAVWRIPDPDYDHHPAYGRLFGRPRLADRLRALAKLLPHLGAYAAYDVLSRLRRRPAPAAFAAKSPVFEALERDGVTALRLAPADMQAIQAALEPAMATLRAKLADPAAAVATTPAPGSTGLAGLKHQNALSALHKQLNPYSSDNELFIHEGDAPAVFEALRAAMRSQGVLEAASRYQGKALDVRFLKLAINHAVDHWWRAPFADVGLDEPPAISMHVDHLWTTKAILYLSPVGPDNGPFCYCLSPYFIRRGPPWSS